MKWPHWVLLALVFLAAVAFDRFFPQLGNMVPLLPKS